MIRRLLTYRLMLRKSILVSRLGLTLIGSFVLLFVLLFSISMTNSAMDMVRQTVGQLGGGASAQIVHHGMGNQATRSSSHLFDDASEIRLPAHIAQTDPFTDHISIRPLTDIYVDGPPQLVNITTTYATLLFTSSVPVNCSVVYGPSFQESGESFGLIAQDPNMNGGAIVDHRPFLTGLLPETEYEYRVQGTDASGTIYVSEVATFTTPVEPVNVADEINVAALGDGAEIVAVSSNFGGAENDGTWGAESAIDENPATAWSSAGDGNDAFIEVGLMEPSVISAIDVWTRFMTNGTAQIFQFTVTTDPGDSDSATFGPFTLPDKEKGYRFAIDSPTVVESVRLDVIDSSGGNTGLVEFKVFAGPTVTATTTNRLELFLPMMVR